MMSFIAFVIAILGYWFNGINKYRIYSYVLWIISNSYWAVISVDTNIWMFIMFITYNIFCLINFIKLIRKKNE